MYLTSLVTIRIGVEQAVVQRKLPDCVVVGLQLYLARIFHVTLPPQICNSGQGLPPNNHQHLRQYKPSHRTWGITQLEARNCLNLCVPCTIEF